MPLPPVQPELLEIRRYPNRRLYDVTRSKTVTLDELHRLIVEGHQVRVTETASGEDITAKVLTQMILDLDSGKLELFPAELLHRILQSNEALMHEFLETHFHRALDLFLRSKSRFEEQFRSVLGLGGEGWPAADWSRAWWAPGPAGPAPDAGGGELRGMVDDLRRQVEDLRRRVGAGNPPPEPTS